MRTIRDLTPMTWTECETKLGTRDTVKLAHNTWLHVSIRRPGCFGITLHRTEIITIHPDEQWELNAQGWHTSTTKQRMNALTPANIWSDKGAWMVGGGHDFVDGIRVDWTGEPCAIIPSGDAAISC